jgi:hypothetical protein
LQPDLFPHHLVQSLIPLISLLILCLSQVSSLLLLQLNHKLVLLLLDLLMAETLLLLVIEMLLTLARFKILPIFWLHPLANLQFGKR